MPPRLIATGLVNRIAYAGVDGHVYTAKPDGTDRIQISPWTGPGSPGGQYTWPVWSPDGGSVMFSSVLEAANGGSDVSLLRAPALGGEHVTMYTDDPQSLGIGNGVPHFAMWSPDGNRVALIAGASQELVTLVLDSETGKFEGVAVGAPVYLAWSPDSNFLLVHLRDTLFLYQMGLAGERGRRSLQLSNPAQNYYAPHFAPADNRFAYGDEVQGEKRLLVRQAEGVPPLDLGEAAGIVGFRWSPADDHVAVARGGDTGLFERLSVVSAQGGAEREVLRRTLYAFWWSPDGKKLAVAAASKSYRLAVDWLIVDVATAQATPLVTNLPSPESEFVLSFFDQYGNASQIWSPDSTRIVVAGSMLPAAQPVAEGDTPPPPPRGVPENVWVLDAAGAAAPVSIGEGFLAFWSPK